jgi:hypothetical protein
MISGYHDLDLRSRFALVPVAVGIAAGVQVIVSDICQFDALEDPEDRPPSVLGTMVSAVQAVRGCPAAGVILAGSRVLAASWWFIPAAR